MPAAWRSIRPARTAAHRRRRHRPPSGCGILRFRPRLELVEDRTLLSTFLVTSTADSGPGSLRQAILDSNAATGQTNTIDFAIPGQGVQTIAPVTSMPSITQAVLIDGESQPAYAGTPLIQLDGSQAGGGDGLTITGSDVTARGLDVTNFSQGAGIHITGASATGNWIYGNFLGTDPTGTQAAPNNEGAEIDGGATRNLIGTNDDGANNTAERNLLSGNLFVGVWITGQGTRGNAVQGNFIGTDASGTASMPNSLGGIAIFDSNDNTIGGATSGAGNLITNNSGPGVAVGYSSSDTSVGDQITANRIFGNSGQAIDLEDDGVTYNSNAPRQGPNDLQNFPIIEKTGDGRLKGWLGGSLPDATFRIDLYASTAYGPGGSGEAQDYLGSLEVTTDSRGEVTFDVPFTPPANLPVVTATATDPHGNTSEVSALRRAAFDAPSRSVHLVPGQPLLLSAASGNGVALQDPDAGPLDPAWDLTLSASVGTLTLASTTGLVGSGDGTASLHYHGGLTELNSALEGLRFTPPPLPHVLAVLSLGAESYGAPPPQAQFPATDGVFVVTTTADSGPGSLRQAILDSNTAIGGPNTIDFAITGKGVQTIAPASSLPVITTSVLIDGSSQPGYVGTPLVALDTQSSGSADGLTITGSDVTVRGLSVGGFGLGSSELSDILILRSPPLREGQGGNVDRYQIDTTNDGRFVALIHPESLTTRVSLLDSHGRVLVQSDGLSPSNPDAIIDQHLAPGAYFLAVETGGGQGTYTLTTTLMPATAPFQPVAVGSFPVAIVAGDFNGDGRLDLATANNSSNDISVVLGNGDGTFQPAQQYAAGFFPVSLAVGDFNGDGKQDLAVADGASGEVFVLLGNGDGTFQPGQRYAVGLRPSALVAADLTGDGHLDLAVTNSSDNTVSVLLGRGDGTFQPQATYPVGNYPAAIVAGDFNGDGRIDLAVANSGNYGSPGTVSVLLGNGDGTFQPQQTFAAGGFPRGIVAGDFNSDGHLDLAVANNGDNTVSVLLGRGDGTFRSQQAFVTGLSPWALVPGDFNGDGRLDLAVLSAAGVSVLPGKGDGTFGPAKQLPVGISPIAIAAGDFNDDGRLDVAIADSASNDVIVLAGKGDGTFQAPAQDQVGTLPSSVVAGDFNGDHRLDLAVDNLVSNNVSVLLGNGDGTYQPQVAYAVGAYPSGMVEADFNRDGRADLAVACNGEVNTADPGGVSILLGNGDGTFQPAVNYPAGIHPDVVVAGDFNGDGKLDLAVTFSGSYPTYLGGVSVLLGNGDGTFQPAKQYAAGLFPGAVVVGDFNGDGKADLAVVNADENTGDPGGVSILLGNGDGTFQPAREYAAGSHPTGIVAGDFNGDGKLDLAVADQGLLYMGIPGGVSILLGNGDGTLQPPVNYGSGKGPNWVVAGDFNGDGKLDLAFADLFSSVVAVLLGNGDGTFQPQVSYGVGLWPISIVAGDFNGDGKLDLVSANFLANDVSTLLGNGDGTFTDPGQFATTPHSTPLVADVNGDGTNDALVVDGAGSILYRQGIPGQPGSFEPPVTVNPTNPSRDIAWVPNSSQGPLIASVDAHDDRVSLYAYRGGRFVQAGSLNTGLLPAQIIAADLSGDGWTDLVVRNTGVGTLSVFFNNQLGSLQAGTLPFQWPVALPVGVGVSDVQAVDTTGSGRLGLVVTNKLTGQVGILPNLGNATFGPLEPYRAGTGLSAVDPTSSPEVTSLDATAGVAAGPLAPGGPTDLVTANPGSYTLGVLAGLGDGRFANPTALDTQHPAQVVRLADLTGNGILDLVLLGPTGVSVMLGDGKGGFLSPATYDAGLEASGLTIGDVNHDGNPNLLIGNPYGDVLVLLGEGDGTFRPYREANQTIALAVADLTGNGSKDVIFADQGLDRVVVDYGAGGTTVLGDHSTGLLSPGAVKLADLNGDGIPDLIVANSGSNNVLIYPGLGNGQFGPAINGGNGYFVGTNPVGITVANLTGGLPDLEVTDKGSNQVSILLNTSQPGGAISFNAGPRLNSGGTGPVSTVVGHFTSGPNQDILVTNSGSNNVALLPGVGGGFFNDTNPQTFAVGTNPGPLFVGNFDGKPDLVTVNAGSNDLTLISDFMSADHVTSTISSGGTDPETAFSFSTSSGFDDLVVGNGGDGVLSLFEGGDQGLTLTSSQTNPDLPSPSAVVYAGLAGGDVQFYAASAGREAAALVALSLGGEIAPIASPATPATPVVPQLIPLQESSVTLVGTLLITTLPSSEAEVILARAETEVAATVSQSSSAPVAPNQSVLVEIRSDETGGGDEPPAQAQAAKDAAEAPAGFWQRHVLGTDEAIEQFDREHPDLFPPRRDNPPQTNPPQGQAHPAEGDRLEAIDQAIDDVTDRRWG
jgi:hypothetical protein